MARIKVPQSDGEIRISRAGDEPTVYRVTDGVVTVAKEEVDGFLSAIEGSKVEGSTAGGSPTKTKE